MRLNFSAVLLKYYDKKLVEIVKSIVSEVCGNIKRLHIPDEQNEALPDLSEINMGTTLFELYLVLKRFLTLGICIYFFCLCPPYCLRRIVSIIFEIFFCLFSGKSLCPNEELAMEDFHTWFMTGVTHWLDISVVKALNRIEKAIELDTLVAVDETVKYSSSAVDTLAIFYQIKIFWQQLDWPDAEGSYTFVAKIVDVRRRNLLE